ncbi:MAG: peptidase MA family metallohydrolase, partial [Chloroflexota bacterium]|nr:peptidase MA family metallohydrolase [Chloroflexota bacterium]
MNRTHRAPYRRLTQAAGVAVLALLSVLVAPPSARADHAVLGEPEADAVLGRPVTFRTALEADAPPDGVELLLSLPGERQTSVIPAQLREVGGGWQAEATVDGHVPPNTRFSYRFRLRHPDADAVLGRAADAVLTDERFTWRTIEGQIVRLHWYQGDEAFAQRALEVGERAIEQASGLLGVTESAPIDFFIYDSEDALRTALGPGTRENVAGQAHSDIRTLFGLIEPFEVGSDWVETLVTHEMTHLVFDTATDNPYHRPPRWLNEGVAVYLSEGYDDRWRGVINEAVRRRTVIPLDGLGGLFPTTREQFELAYAEGVSAVNFFIETYQEETFWNLVRSYAEGVSDDDAFVAATGADLAAFNAAWLASLGVEVPQPIGPRPAPPGPLPPGWEVAQPTPAAGAGQTDRPAG